MRDGVLERLTGDPTAWATIVRHLVPIAGVLLAGWSALETLVALFLDAWSVLLGLAGVAAAATMRGFVHERMDVLDRVNVVAGAACLFVVLGALLGFAVLVPATMLLGVVARDGAADLWTLARTPGLYASFASMLACQVPRAWTLVSELDDAEARRIVEPQVGFVLVRVILVGAAGLVLGVLPSGASLVAGLIVAQIVLATTEIWSDRLRHALAARASARSQSRTRAR